MARTQSVSDTEIRQICVDLFNAGQKITTRAVHRLSGGDMNRVQPIVNQFKKERGLDPMPARRPNHINDLTDDERQLAIDVAHDGAIEIARQIKHQLLQNNENFQVAVADELLEVRQDLTYAVKLNGELMEKLVTLEGEREQEHQTHQRSLDTHAATTRQLKSEHLRQMVQAQKDSQSQMKKLQEAHRQQLVRLQKQNEELSNKIIELKLLNGEDVSAKAALEEQARMYEAQIDDQRQMLRAAEVRMAQQVELITKALVSIVEKAPQFAEQVAELCQLLKLPEQR